MEQTGIKRFLYAYNPAIPRRGLFLIAGIIWTLVGLMLCARAVGWLFDTPPLAGVSLAATSVIVAAGGYRFGFAKIVQKNVNRIYRLPERVCLFAFTAWRGYFMIALMVTLGITLRHSPLPKIYLILPYSAMGVVLLIGSIIFYYRFLDN